MADLALTTAGRVEVVESIEQATLPAGEAIVAGAPVRIDTNGKFVNGNGTTSTEAAVYGIATRSAAANEAVTAIKKGVLDGFALGSIAYNTSIYVSDTDATLASAASDATVDVIVGRVIPAWSQPLGTAADKLLEVDL